MGLVWLGLAFRPFHGIVAVSKENVGCGVGLAWFGLVPLSWNHLFSNEFDWFGVGLGLVWLGSDLSKRCSEKYLAV